MSTFKIFEQDVGSKTFEVWVTNGLVQYVIDDVIQHDITSVTDFLVAAAKLINKPNATDDSIVLSAGAISDNALEHYEGGNGPVLDTGGTNPAIALQDDGTLVKISGGGVSGNVRIDFGNAGAQSESEAQQLLDFAEGLLGKAQQTQIESFSYTIGDKTGNVKISLRDDDIQQINWKPTGNNNHVEWADKFVEELAEMYGGTKLSDGKVSEKNYTANQLNIDGTEVGLGADGVGGKEEWSFANATDAQSFHDAVDQAFGDPANRANIINSAIEAIAEDLGGNQTHNGNVSVNYQAKQIRLMGSDKDIVDLGSHGVGGKERYEFADQATAQEFIDLIRDAMGIGPVDGKLVDEFIYKTGGALPTATYVGKDAFIEYLGISFGGTRTKNGSVSESYTGGSRIVGDGTDVKLGPQSVGGTEIWDFDSVADADAFVLALDDIFG